MADPVTEVIAKQYVTALKRIKVAQQYQIDIGERVFRFIHLRGDELPYACVVTEGEEADIGRPARHYYSILTVQVYLMIRNTDELDTARNKGIADVKRAILSDLGLRGGHNGTIPGVNRTDFVRAVPAIVDADGFEEVSVEQITFTTNYIFNFQDPYIGRGEG